MLTEKYLKDLLLDAKERHTCFEKETGKTDPDWPGWYAAYMLKVMKADGKFDGGGTLLDAVHPYHLKRDEVRA